MYRYSRCNSNPFVAQRELELELEIAEMKREQRRLRRQRRCEPTIRIVRNHSTSYRSNSHYRTPDRTVTTGDKVFLGTVGVLALASALMS